MPTRFLPSLSKPLAGLLLVLLAPMAVAQQGSAALSDSERAKRDANKVLSFIKFHAVRAPRPAAAPVAAPAPAMATVAAVATAPAPARPRAAPVVARESDGLQVAALDQAAMQKTAGTMSAPALGGERPGITLPPVSEPQPQVQPVEVQPQPSPAPVEPVPEPDAEDLVELKLIEHVQPELPRGNGLRDGSVRVRFTVMPDGSVQKVTTNSSAQRRLATAATRAVQQWRFEAIQEATEVEVDVDFRFD
jgi:protein TonB